MLGVGTGQRGVLTRVSGHHAGQVLRHDQLPQPGLEVNGPLAGLDRPPSPGMACRLWTALPDPKIRTLIATLQPTGKVKVLLGVRSRRRPTARGDQPREDVHEDRPCTVVQPPPLIQLDRGRGQQVADATGEPGDPGAGHWTSYSHAGTRRSVDGPRSLAVGDTAAWNVPVGRTEAIARGRGSAAVRLAQALV